MDQIQVPSATNTASRRSSRIHAASTASDKSGRSTPQEDRDDDQTPAEAEGTRKSERVNKSDPLEEVLNPLTEEERKAWKGWCELESDPALFNFILREYGIKHVKVQEIVALEDNVLAFLPKPVYGLVFLFKCRDGDEEEEEDLPKCPNYVWFANQTTHNACATIALMNIVMNVPEVDLGEKMSSFKATTQRLKSAYRGKSLSDNDWIRNIHNSFIRKMDILIADLALAEEVAAWKREKKSKKTKKGIKKKNKSDEELGFHFIAFVPINGIVWKLDGLQRQPINLGDCGADWVSVARADIHQRISQYEDNSLQFNLLALCRSPLRSVPEQLAQNIHSICKLETILAEFCPDWHHFIDVQDPGLVTGPDESFGLSEVLINSTTVPDWAQRELENANRDSASLMELRNKWVADQSKLRTLYVEEVALVSHENQEAFKKKQDFTPLVYKSIKTLAEKGVLKDIMKEV